MVELDLNYLKYLENVHLVLCRGVFYLSSNYSSNCWQIYRIYPSVVTHPYQHWQ